MLVARAEAASAEGLERLKGELKQALAQHNVRLPF
jgi:hypothetical protein